MLSCGLKCRKNTENKNAKVVKTKNGRIMVLSKCAICGNKKSRFIKEQEAGRFSTAAEILFPPLAVLDTIKSIR